MLRQARSRLRTLLPVAASILLTCVAAGPVVAGEPPFRMQSSRLDITVQDDGTAVYNLHFEMAVANDAAAQQNAQLPLTFSDAVEKLELVDAYTLKPDGRHVPVDASGVRVQLAPGVPNLPIYSDRKQMVAVFPEAAGGDVFVSNWRRSVFDPVIPGEFSHVSLFPRNTPWDDSQITITTPADKPLHTESHGPVLHETTAADGKHVYHWTYKALPMNDAAVLSPLDRAPRLFASTMPDWPAFSRAYAALALPKTAITPRLQALADEVTTGVTDRREQARRLYEWVERHVRWVAVYLGNGPIVPHDAASVLARGYGDCKDQVVLLVALLRAKNIPADPVLINLSASYQLSRPAGTWAFNHVIIHLPEWNIYADTTPGGAPFGTLQLAEYGKPVLPVTLQGEQPGRIAPLGPDVAVARLRTSATLGGSGRVTGDTELRATGPFAVSLGQQGRRIQAIGSDQAAGRQLRSLGEPGSGSFGDLVTDEASGTTRLSGHFTLEPHPDWVDSEWFQPPSGLRLLTRVGEGLIGPLRTLPADEPTPCYAGRQEEALSLVVPDGYRPVQLPKNASVKGSFFQYESKWAFEHGAVTVERAMQSRFDQPFCQGAARAEAARSIGAIRRDLDARISLEKAE